MDDTQGLHILAADGLGVRCHRPRFEVSSRDLRRQATSLLRLAGKLERSSSRNAVTSADLAARATRQMEASRVAMDMARRQLSR